MILIFLKVVGLAILGILIVIAILLRSYCAALYVGTVLLNYGTTLGLTTWIFLDLMKEAA